MKNVKINTEMLNNLQNIEQIAKKDAKTVKYELLDAYISVEGTKWHRMKESTRNAVDFLFFLGAESGYIYAKPSTIAQKHGIAQSTVYNVLKTLKEAGQVVTVYRESRTQNGLGSPINIFVNHPNFNHICSVLDLEWKANEKADKKAENSAKPCESKVTEDKNSPTYLSLPTSFNENNCIHSNVREAESIEKNSSSQKYIKYVPKIVNEQYANIFDEDLLHIWRKIKQSIKQVDHSLIDNDSVLEIGMTVIRSLYQSMKNQKREFTLDEMLAYVYKTTASVAFNLIGEMFVETMIIDDEGRYRYVDVVGNTHVTSYTSVLNMFNQYLEDERDIDIDVPVDVPVEKNYEYEVVPEVSFDDYNHFNHAPIVEHGLFGEPAKVIVNENMYMTSHDYDLPF